MAAKPNHHAQRHAVASLSPSALQSPYLLVMAVGLVAISGVEVNPQRIPALRLAKKVAQQQSLAVVGQDRQAGFPELVSLFFGRLHAKPCQPDRVRG